MHTIAGLGVKEDKCLWEPRDIVLPEVLPYIDAAVRSEGDFLIFEHRSLDVYSTEAVAWRQASGSVDHPVAGEFEISRDNPHRPSDRPSASRIPQQISDLPIGSDLPPRYPRDYFVNLVKEFIHISKRAELGLVCVLRL